MANQFTVAVTDENFEQEVLKSELPTLVDFWAAWCMPCRMVSPIVDEIAKEYQGKMKVCKLDVDHNPETSARYGIMSIPTLMVFKNGEPVQTVVGAMPKRELLKRITPVL